MISEHLVPLRNEALGYLTDIKVLKHNVNGHFILSYLYTGITFIKFKYSQHLCTISELTQSEPECNLLPYN